MHRAPISVTPGVGQDICGGLDSDLLPVARIFYCFKRLHDTF